MKLQESFRAVLEIFIPKLQLPQDQPLSKRICTKYRVSDDACGQVFSSDQVPAEELAALVGHCEKLRLDTEAESLLNTIQKECTTRSIDSCDYESSLLPMLTSMLSTLPKRHTHR